MKRAVCPGSFDPITFGHLDIIGRASTHFDEILVVVSENRSKKTLFTVEERVEMIRESTKKYSNVLVEGWYGLTYEFCKQNNVSVIVKGLRAVTDFDYELQMAQANYQGGQVETMFMATAPAYSFLSSSLVKEIALFGGDVSPMVPPNIAQALRTRLAGK